MSTHETRVYVNDIKLSAALMNHHIGLTVIIFIIVI